MNETKGGFTLPGEAGYEELTLELARKWGADVIRDSDGTVLSDEIIDAGYGIYSTICIIREHNEWAKSNPDKLQQCFLCTYPKVAEGDEININLMEDFFASQFEVNDSEDSRKRWQVFDRTTNTELQRNEWTYDSKNQTVTIKTKKWHKYTVSFLAFRIWEEISMYNHTTNNWDKEHLMQIDPIYPQTQEYLLNWMDNWCKEHPATTVVRFTSLFYNFVWIWGSSERNRHLFTDWASYDFTVSPAALDLFTLSYGYSLTAEDFINKGKLHATHTVPDSKKRDWMAFVNKNVIAFGKKLIDIVHGYGKKAYVFYDDSWVGIEPYGERFVDFGFDGIIKCVFSGYEARLCAGVRADTHEIRLHPYLFPVGLGGAPTFAEGGNPTADAKGYWRNVRRALLREPVDRIGLGGYLHLVCDFPDFQEYIAALADEFRFIKNLHKTGKPYILKPRIAILHAWGKLRSWTLSGHFHETYMHDLIHVLESLSGLPFDISFIDFNDLKEGSLDGIDVIINAGVKDSAWSGGTLWADEKAVCAVTDLVAKGGAFIGINEPSATDGFDTVLRMSHVLGMDIDLGDRVCHGKWKYEITQTKDLIPENISIKANSKAYLTSGSTEVLVESAGIPVITSNRFGKGMGVYLSSYENTPYNTRLLQNLILYVCGEDIRQDCITDNPHTECAYYPAEKELVIINNSAEEQTACVSVGGNKHVAKINPFDLESIHIN